MVAIALVVPHLVPVKKAIAYDVARFRATSLRPGENWFVIRNYQTSNATWAIIQSDRDSPAQMLTALTGRSPRGQLSNWFVNAEATMESRNTYLVVGALGRKDSEGEYEFQVREWEIVAPVERGFNLHALIAPRSYLSAADFRWFGRGD